MLFVQIFKRPEKVEIGRTGVGSFLKVKESSTSQCVCLFCVTNINHKCSCATVLNVYMDFGNDISC